MTSEQWHKDKVVAYIVIGIIVVIGIALYVYMQLASMSAQQVVVVPSRHSSGPVVLTPAQSAAKTEAIEAVTVQKPVPLTKKQSAAKAAIIKAFEMQNSGK
jgi:hypothetical protein